METRADRSKESLDLQQKAEEDRRERERREHGATRPDGTREGTPSLAERQGIAPLSDEDKARRSAVIEGYVGTPEQARRNAQAQERTLKAVAVSQIYDEARDTFAVIADTGTIIRHLRAHDPDIPDYTPPIAAGLSEDMLVVPPPYVQSERGRRETDEEATKNRERDEAIARDERHDATRQAVKDRDAGAGTVSRAPTPDRAESQRRQTEEAGAHGTGATGASSGATGGTGAAGAARPDHGATGATGPHRPEQTRQDRK